MGPMLGKLRLRSHEGLRGSGDDLRTYFYQLRRHDSGLARNAFGRRIPGADVTEYGGQPGKSYRLALCVVGMGDHNAVDFSQEVHVQLLKAFGLCQDSCLLRYGKPLPTSGLLEGVYIDDHLVLLKASKAFTAWGTEVRSEDGTAAAPIRKRAEFFCLACSALSLPAVEKDLLRRLVGNFVFPFMHRRECMSTFHRVYKFMSELEIGEVVGCPSDIRDEIALAALLLPLAASHLRWPISGRDPHGRHP